MSSKTQYAECKHHKVRCLNQYDTFRKYVCEDCGGVFMCECERELALTFLPHQVHLGSEYGTRKEYRVNGFALNICCECRGLKEEAYPRAAINRQKGKIERFYWREIFKTYCGYVQEWLQQNGGQVQDVIEFERNFPDIARDLKQIAKNHWKKIHKVSPKYDLKEQTEAEFLRQIPVPVREIERQYRQIEKGNQKIGRWLNVEGQLVSTEKIAIEYYQSKGYSVLCCERTLMSAWVGTFLAAVIQDQNDPRVRQCFRCSTRGWTPQTRNTPIIMMYLPEDFGSKEYYNRRCKELESSIKQIEMAPELERLFLALIKESESLRDYLWVNTEEAIELARLSLTILPREHVVAAVRWAIKDFWNRQPGWPDLLVYRENEFFFSEVKSPHDELSQEQMNWFQWAVQEARIPCEICRVKKAYGATADP